MSAIAEHISELQLICPGAQEMPESGITYIFLPALTISDSVVVDALLCPQQHSGYPTRLFLAQPIAGKGANWSVHAILSRQWHTWSWNYVAADQTLAQILAQHLRA